MLCLVLLTHAAVAADANGIWTGQLVSSEAQRTSSAYLILKQEGAKLTGSGGPNAEEQHPIANGAATEDGKLTFDIPLENGTIRLSLQQKGDSMEGPVVMEREGRKENGTLSVQRSAPAAAFVSLPDQIRKLDSALFSAYNACDLEKMAAFFAEGDVEFYHDQGGLMTSKADVIAATKKNICGKVRRELVAESVEVYPIPGYGAVQIGAHKFYNRSSGKEEGGDKAAKFLHIWKQDPKAGEWKLTRVVSYAH